MQKKYTVVIADDHTVLRTGLKNLLNASDDLTVVGEAENGLEAIQCIKEKKPDIALLDINMPKLGGISVIKEITVTLPKTKMMVLTMHDKEEYLKTAFRCGAQGYCLKTASHSELLSAIRAVLSGKTFVSSDIRYRSLEFDDEKKNRDNPFRLKQEVDNMGKIKKKRVRWQPSASSDVTGYRLYWSDSGEVDYHSSHTELGNVLEFILPDDISSFFLEPGNIALGISAIDKAGNESDITQMTAYFNFAVPKAPKGVEIEDALEDA